MSEMNAKHASMLAQANQLKEAIKQEEDLIVKLVEALPGGKVLIKLPTSLQWKYEYEKKSRYSPEFGVATARFILLKVSCSFGTGKRMLDAFAGPTFQFVPQALSSFPALLDRVGGFDSLLNLIGEKIDEQLQTRNQEGGKSAEKVDVLLERVRSEVA